MRRANDIPGWRRREVAFYPPHRARKLSYYLPDGGQRIVRLLRKTDVLGLECMISDEYQHSAIALQPAEVCRLPASAVKKLLRKP